MTDIDYGASAQRAAEEHLEAYLYSDECDCVTCLVREVLTAAWPILIEAAKAEA